MVFIASWIIVTFLAIFFIYKFFKAQLKPGSTVEDLLQLMCDRIEEIISPGLFLLLLFCPITNILVLGYVLLMYILYLIKDIKIK